MADGLQSFNVPVQPAGLPPPGLQPTQFTAPSDYQAVAPQQFTGPTLPAPVSYAIQPPAQTSTAPDALPPGSHPPPFLAVLKNAETGLGRPLTPEEFDKFTNDYKTNYAVPALNAQFKGKKANVEAEVASFDNQVQHLREQRYAAQTAAAGQTGALGAFGLGALGGLEKGAAGLGVLGASVADVGGLAPNRVADWMRGQANVDQQSVAQNAVKQLTATRDSLLMMYPKDEAKIRADLDPKIAALTSTAGTPNLITRANTNNEVASKDHPVAAFLGGVTGQIAPFLLTRGAGTLATATGEAVGRTGANAAEQLNAGQNLGTVQTQAAIDAPLETLAAYLPAHFSGKLLSRVLKGVAVGGGTNAVQQGADVAVNPNNKFDTTSLGASTALAAAIAAIPYAHVNAGLNILKRGANALKGGKEGAVPESTQAGTETPPANAGAAPEGAAPTGDGAKPASTPIDFYKTMIDTAPADGIEQPAFIKLQASALEKANTQAKKADVAAAIKAVTTPEDVVQKAWILAQRFTGKQWDNLNGSQRAQTVETMAAWLGKKSKVDMESIDAHLQTLRNPAEAAPVQPGVTEQPLPADIQGQQVPGTVEKAPPQTAVPLSNADPKIIRQRAQNYRNAADALLNEDSVGNKEQALALHSKADALDAQADIPYTPNQKYDSVWQQVTDANTPTEALPPDGRLLRSALDAGKITSREQFDTLLDTAAANKAKGNTLKAKTAAKVVAEPITAGAETAKKAVADTVTEALADNSTPETQKNKLKTAVKQQTEKQFNQAYFKALANRDSAPADTSEATIRQDPAFNAASEAMRQGKITSAEDVGRFLKEQKGTSTVGDALAGHENKQIGALLGSKSTKSEIVQARKAIRENLVDPLSKLGEDPDAVKQMTVAQAMTHLQKLANTFNSGEAAPTKKGLAKGKTNIEPVENPDETPPTKPKSKTLKGKPKSPKAEAPASEAGATPLESQLRKRFGDTLPLKRLDSIHDAVSEARMGDNNKLLDEIAGLRANDGEISDADIKWLKSLGKETPLEDIQNNASGESSASLEAQHRLADEKAAGQTRAIIRRDGSVEPMHGVDAVDIHARAGEVVVQRGVGKDDWTILSHGDDLGKDAANGKVNRARAELNELHEEARKPTLREVETLNDSARKNAAKADLAPERVAPVQVKRRVSKIVDEVREGADVHETGRKLQKLHDDMEQATMERRMRDAIRPERRGVEYVRSRLQKMISDSTEGDDHYEAGKFGLWLLEKNPNLANYLALRIRSIGKDGEGAAGQFSPSERLVHINSKNTNPGTAVHEILHSAEQLMPSELQDNIRGEYLGRLQNKYKQVVKSGNKVAQRYIQLAIEGYVHPSAEGQREMSLLMRTQQKDIPYDEYYKYSNPSEYFAVEGTRILQGRYEAGSVRARLQTWMKEFVQHVKSFLGLDSNSAVIKAVNEILKSRGEEYNPKMLASRRKTFNDEQRATQEGDEPTDDELGYESKSETADPNLEKEAPIVRAKESNKNLGPISKGQHFIESFATAGHGLEKAVQGATRLGVKITETNNVDRAASAKNGLQSEYNNKDLAEAYAPSENWVYDNEKKFAKNTAEMLDKVNKFFHNTNWLERGYTSWYDESPLGFEGALDRADIKEQMQKGEISDIDARKQIIALANKHAEFTPEEWMKHEGMPVDTLKSQLKKLADESGMDQKSMGELNTLMDLARNRTRERLIAAGRIVADDPYVGYYGWKWYVPLKGSAYGADTTNFDLIPTKNIALARLNKQIEAMEGRTSFAERPFSRLFADMTRAGSAQADAHLKSTAYELVTDIMEKDAKSGYEIHPFEGGYKDGYTNTKTGEHVDKLKAPLNGFIVNDGDTHYVITTPKDSQLLRGLIKLNEVEKPNAFESMLSHPTNGLARLYTTLHPGWQTFSGFVRDLTTIPLTDAVTKHANPFNSLPTLGKYYGNVLQAYKALPTLIPHLLAHNPKALKAFGLKTPRQMGEAAPNSWAGWTRRYEAAGGANYFTQGFDVAGVERLMQRRLQDVDGVLDAAKWTWKEALEYTGNYANFLEGIGRVALFKTKVEMGIPESEAAVDVRRTLDYSNSGTKGRRINSWLAFFRVGMTSADAMRKAFTKPTGGLDYKKMAAWQGFLGAAGAGLYMAATAMLGEDAVKKVDPNLLTQKMLIPGPDGKIIGFNLGLGMPQVMMAPGILMAAVQNGHIKPEEAAKIYIDTLARNGPISPAGNKDNTPTNFLASYVLGFTPTIARPIVDVDRNTTVFNSSIHAEPRSGQYPSDTGRTNTPQVFKDIARWLADNTDHKVDYAPEDIRYFAQNYGGQWASELIRQASNSKEAAAGVPDSSRMGGSKLFVDTSHYMQNEMYDTLDQLQDSWRRYTSIVSRAKDDGASDAQAKAQADQIVSRDPQFKKELLSYRALDNARKAYQQKINELRNNKLMSDTRKQLVRKQLDSQMRMAIEKAQTGIDVE